MQEYSSFVPARLPGKDMNAPLSTDVETNS